jgi:hypothetical protein
MQKNVWNIFCPVSSAVSNNFLAKLPVRICQTGSLNVSNDRSLRATLPLAQRAALGATSPCHRRLPPHLYQRVYLFDLAFWL